jgi:hypothetical protein
MRDEIYVVGSSWLTLDDSSDLQLDEAVFEAVSAALKTAGVKRHQIGFSVTSSLDLYDSRSISNALTAPAAAGYLTDELRVEGDASAAFLVGTSALVSDQADFAVVVASNIPEAGSTREQPVGRLLEHISSYTFDSHIERPVGITANAVLGMHAAASLDAGDVSWDDMVRRTSEEITRGAGSGRSQRGAVTPEQVASAPVSVAPLTELMLPAANVGVGVVVLGAGVEGRRCPRVQTRLRGWGTATSPSPSNPAWLDEPVEAPRRAAAAAYRRAGMEPSGISYAEITDLTPSITERLTEALGLGHLAAGDVNRSGGVRSNHPGIANGLLRVIEASEQLGSAAAGDRALVHAAGNLMGLTSSTSAALVLEAQ